MIERVKVDEISQANVAVDEAGKVRVVFSPSEDQVAFLHAALKPDGGVSIEEWLASADIHPSKFGVWRLNGHFVAWLIAEFEKQLDIYRVEWLKTGLVKMKEDHKHWTEMGRILYPNGVQFNTGKEGRRTRLETELMGIFHRKVVEIKEGVRSD